MNDDEDPSSSNGGRASKKQKTMKIPRRGLGVAQLEKLRLEEVEKQQNNQIQGSVTTNTVTASLYSLPPLPPPTRLHNQKIFLFSDLNNVNDMKDSLGSSSSSARRPSLPVPLPAFSNLHMEPPSNQSSSGNKLIEEEKVENSTIQWKFLPFGGVFSRGLPPSPYPSHSPDIHIPCIPSFRPRISSFRETDHSTSNEGSINLTMIPRNSSSKPHDSDFPTYQENVNEPFPVPFYRFLPMSNGTDEAALDHPTRASGSVGAASDQQMGEASATEKIDLTLRL